VSTRENWGDVIEFVKRNPGMKMGDVAMALEKENVALRARLATVEAALLAADRLASYTLDVCRADTDQKHAAAYRMARRSALAGDAPGEGK
jgi:hypothetical protein